MTFKLKECCKKSHRDGRKRVFLVKWYEWNKEHLASSQKRSGKAAQERFRQMLNLDQEDETSFWKPRITNIICHVWFGQWINWFTEDILKSVLAKIRSWLWIFKVQWKELYACRHECNGDMDAECMLFTIYELSNIVTKDFDTGK